MKTKASSIEDSEADTDRIKTLIKDGVKELAEIRKANKAADVVICKLRASTLKKFSRIRENLQHVETAR